MQKRNNYAAGEYRVRIWEYDIKLDSIKRDIPSYFPFLHLREKGRDKRCIRAYLARGVLHRSFPSFLSLSLSLRNIME